MTASRTNNTRGHTEPIGPDCAHHPLVIPYLLASVRPLVYKVEFALQVDLAASRELWDLGVTLGLQCGLHLCEEPDPRQLLVGPVYVGQQGIGACPTSTSRA